MTPKLIILGLLLTVVLTIMGCQNTTIPEQKSQEALKHNLVEPSKPEEPKTVTDKEIKGSNSINTPSAPVASPATPKTQPQDITSNNKKVPIQPKEPDTPSNPTLPQ